MAQQIRELHKTSLRQHSILIFSCGFDSVPSDLCAYLAVKHLNKVTGSIGQAEKVRGVMRVKDQISGGTFASVLGFLELPLSAAKELTSNAYVLSPGKPLQMWWVASADNLYCGAAQVAGKQRLKTTWVTKQNGKWAGFFAMV